MSIVPTIKEYIKIAPDLWGGKPPIASYRIKLEDTVIWHEHIGMCPEEISYNYPSTTLADIDAALAYNYLSY